MPSLEGAKLQAATYPGNVRAQLSAGHAFREAGENEAAATYFDNAYRLGLPIDGKLRFYFDYGAVLRAVGRVEDSEEILRIAIKEYPYDKALPVFLAMTLWRAGKGKESLATLLEVLVRLRDQVKDYAQHKGELEDFIKELMPPVPQPPPPPPRAPMPPPKPPKEG